MRRSIGSELLRQGTVLAVPLAIVAVFPREALSFRATPQSETSQAFVSMVRLDADAERSAIKSAKSSLRGEAARLQRLRADLSFGELPEEPTRPVLERPEGLFIPATAPVNYGMPAYSPSAAAESPRTIPIVKPAAQPLPFPKTEMLKID